MFSATIYQWCDFLNGAATIDGVWFGERHSKYRGAFWWRTHCIPAIRDTAEQLEIVKRQRDEARAECERLRHAIAEMTADRDCWSDQASSRLNDAVRLAEERDAAIAECKRLRLALEHVRMLAAKNHKEEWAKLMLKWCADVGVKANPLREDL